MGKRKRESDAAAAAALSSPGAAAAAAALHPLLTLPPAVATADLEDRLNLTRRFVANQHVGAVMFAAIAAGKYLA